MTEKVAEIDPLRNAALAGSEAYHNKSALNAQFDAAVKVRKLLDSMPILTKPVAVKLAEKIVDRVNHAVSSSVWAKIDQQEKDLSIEDMVKFCKEQKHDKLFGAVVFIDTYR